MFVVHEEEHLSGNRRPDIALGDHTDLACLSLPCVVVHCSYIRLLLGE